MSTLGEILKNERQRRAMSIHEIAKRTNISEKMLQAMENDQFHLIPGKFYAVNFLKGYLKALELDEKTFFSSHEGAIRKIAPQEDRSPAYYAKIRYSRFKNRRLMIILAALLAILLLSSVLLFLNADPPLLSWLQPQPPRTDIPAMGLTVDPVWHYQSQDYAPVVVEIDPREECWIEAVRGQRILSRGLYSPGMGETFRGYQITLTLGNPSSVALRFNSQEVTDFQTRNRPVTIVFRPDEVMAPGLR